MQNKLSIGARYSAMFLDHVIMCFIAVPLFFLSMKDSFSGIFDPHPAEFDFSGFNIYIAVIAFALYFSKDCINGRSIAKRALKQQVVNNATGEVASPVRCFIRNIFIVIWPVEAIVTFASPQRRIGDMVAGTKVVPYVPPAEKPDINYLQVLVSLILSYSLIILILVGFKWTPGTTSKPSFSKTSFNSELSSQLSNMYTDSLYLHLTADARVYDSSAVPGRKYVSLAIRLKQNYLEDESSMRQLDSILTGMLQTKLPEGTYTGKVKYTYRGDGSFQSSTRDLR